jgi:tripartite ATP-independent transporter DctM subunit
LPSLLLIVIVLGGILGGVFTATEASAVAVAYALLLGVGVYREIKLPDLPRILLRAAKTTSVVMLLVGASQAMSWVLALEQVPQGVSAAMLAISHNSIATLLLINLLLLVVGTFMDMTPAVLIFTPIFLPVVTGLGMDPVHFGVLMVTNLCIGLCTPPVGTCLFVGCSVGGTTIARVARPMLPMFLAMLVALLAITYVPALSLALPHWFGV